MNSFSKVIGHHTIKEYFNRAVGADKVSHSYIFEGPEGVGKKMVAMELAKILLCEEKENNTACNKCKSCHMIEAHTHPDIIVVNKDTKVTKIDTIRDKVVKEMGIKPYQGNYKIIIVAEADTVTTEGQNAMLKTIEETPSYGIVILVVQNIAKLLPTIKSRCIHMRFNALMQKEIMEYLGTKGITGQNKEIYTKFCEGSIGMANKLIEDKIFIEQRRKSIEYLRRLDSANMMQLYDVVKELCDQKEIITSILDFWLLWYRDVALLKSTGSDNLYYLDYKSDLLDTTHKLTYNKISNNIVSVKEAKREIEQNIYATFVIENLLLKLKERKR
ncbi:MAG: DNA polymerase III subunit [Cellulosilyticaceae bacterium]